MSEKIWWPERQVWGYKILPKWLRTAYLVGANFRCQICKQKKPLEINRLIRGRDGGLYTVATFGSQANNVQVICKPCHKLIHSGEPGMRHK